MLIKYIKSVLWKVEKRLSYIEDARCLNFNACISGAFTKLPVAHIIQNITHFQIELQNIPYIPYIPYSCIAISITAETRILASAIKRVLVLATLRSFIRVKSEFKGLYKHRHVQTFPSIKKVSWYW